MFVLTPPPEPEWLTLIDAAGDTPAVRVRMAPVGPAARDAASAAVAQVLAGVEPELREEARSTIGADGRISGEVTPALADLFKRIGRASGAAMMREGLREWSGIGGPDGAPIAVTPTTIGWLLANEELYATLDRLYVLPVALRDAEKNASAGSPAGTGTRATPEPDTASSPAAPIATGDAEPPPASPSASISSTSRDRKKVRSSGR